MRRASSHAIDCLSRLRPTDVARALERRLVVVLTIDEAQGVLSLKTHDASARRGLAKIQQALAGSAA
jgi:hypothetical protein